MPQSCLSDPFYSPPQDAPAKPWRQVGRCARVEPTCRAYVQDVCVRNGAWNREGRLTLAAV